MAARRCEQCGATVELPDGAMGATCAFCDSALVESAEQAEQVDAVASFDISRERAGALLRDHLQGNWMAAESVRRAAQPDELRSVLVPFYAYDAVARTQFSAKIGIYWYRTETYTTVVNGKSVTRTRQVKETDWQGFSGSHAKRWFDHLVSASKGLVEEEANALEPFDLGRALPFSPALTAGLEAEHPTIERATAKGTAAQELSEREKSAISAGHLPGDTHRSLKSESKVEVERVRLVLLPVWVSAFSAPQGSIRLLVNGQTGEVVGQVPRSKWKVGCAVVGVILAVFAALLAVSVLGGGAMALSALVSR